jgi:hypothetical protein
VLLKLAQFGPQQAKLSQVGAPFFLIDTPSRRITHESARLTDQQILALEQARGDQELHIRMNLTGVLPQGPAKYPFAYGEEHIRVATSRWGRQVEDLGRAMAVTIAVPLPPDGDLLSDAGRYLRDAKLLITDGKYELAVEKIRHALEQMRDLKHWPAKPPKDQNDPTQWPQNVRWA